MSRKVVVTAERGNGVWVLEAPEVGAVSQCRRLEGAADEMREAVAYLLGVGEDDVDIEVVPALPVTYAAASAAAEALRQESGRLQAEAADQSRLAARALIDAGLSMRDAATVMGISHQRVAQLAH